MLGSRALEQATSMFEGWKFEKCKCGTEGAAVCIFVQVLRPESAHTCMHCINTYYYL